MMPDVTHVVFTIQMARRLMEYIQIETTFHFDEKPKGVVQHIVSIFNVRLLYLCFALLRTNVPHCHLNRVSLKQLGYSQCEIKFSVRST